MSFRADLQFSLRALLRRPGFTFVVVLILGVGMGATTVIFGVVDTVMLRPLSFGDSDRLVRVMAVNESLGIDRAGLAVGDFQDFREEVEGLEGLAAYTTRDFDLTGDGSPVVVSGALVSSSLFPLLRVEPAEGRGFTLREERPGEGRVVILGDALRRERFGDEPVLGRKLDLDGESHEIVGVMPGGVHFPRRGTQLWVPLTIDESALDRMSHYLGTVGRLQPGVTPDRVTAELEGVAATLAERYPGSNEDWTASAMLFTESLSRPFRPALLVLSGGVMLLLMIACTNVANLLLVRAISRQKEMAIRSALGCPRARATRLLLFESLILAAMGAAVGLALAYWGFGVLATAGPASVPALANVDLDPAAYLFTLVVALVTGLSFSAIPSLKISRVSLHHITKATSGSVGRTSSHLRSALVVAEVALALVLVVGAGLMLKGFFRLSQVDLGFEPEETVMLQVRLSPARYTTETAQIELFETVLAEARSLPGVTSVAAGSSVPFLPSGQNLLAFEPEPGLIDPGEHVFAEFGAVTPGFFRTLGIPLLGGRGFEPQDDADAPPVVIVNQALAEVYWPERPAVGQRLFGAVSGTEPVAYEVVGVVGDVRYRNLDEAPGPAVYVPFRQVPHLQMMVLARGTGDPMQYAGPMSARLLALDAEQPIARMTTLAQLIEEAGGRERFYTGLLSLFGGIGMLLAAVGIYGVITYTFARRKQELAIRMALGADSRSIVGLVLREGFKLTVAGLVLGVLGALALGRLLSGLLYGVSPQDPWVFSLALVVLLGAAFVATSLSARRAARVNALEPLRQGDAAH